MVEKRFIVYALIEGGRIRYIGITSQSLERRLYNHFADMKRPDRKEHKTNWLRSCKRDGLKVEIKPLRVNLSVEDAQRIEKQIIKRLRPTLVNVHEGGSSGYAGLPADAKARHSASGKARFLDPIQRERLGFHLQVMREAKAKKRLANPPVRFPKMKRFFPWEVLIENTIDGAKFTLDLKSARHAKRFCDAVLAHYEPECRIGGQERL